MTGRTSGALKTTAIAPHCSRAFAVIRGVLNGWVAQVLEERTQEHVIGPGQKLTQAEFETADKRVDVMNAYLKWRRGTWRSLSRQR